MKESYLRRLIHLDAELAASTLHINRFAKKHSASPKTIRRDLDLLRALGLNITTLGYPNYTYGYRDGIQLFNGLHTLRMDCDAAGDP